MNEFLAMKGFLIPGVPLTAIGAAILIVIIIMLFASALVNQDIDEGIGTISIILIVAAAMTGFGAWFLHLALV